MLEEESYLQSSFISCMKVLNEIKTCGCKRISAWANKVYDVVT